MTDSNPVNPFEAPSQPSLSAGPTIDEPIRYEATPTIDDLKSALRPTYAIITNSLCLGFLMLLFLAALMGIIAGELPIRTGILLLAGISFLQIAFVFILRSKIFAIRNYLRLNPFATAPLAGELTNQGLLLRSENRLSWLSHGMITSCKVKNNQLSICHNPQGQDVRILPIRGFRKPDQAIRFLEFQANQDSPAMDILEPFTGPILVGDQPADAITFSGEVNGHDLKNSPLNAIRKRNNRRQVITALAIFGFLTTAAFFIMHWLVTLIVGCVMLTSVIATIKNIRSSSKSIDAGTALLAVAGWLNEKEIVMLHNIGQSREGWKDFKTIGVNDDFIWLEPYGVINQLVLLPKRIFVDDAQWQTAMNIAESHLDK